MVSRLFGQLAVMRQLSLGMDRAIAGAVIAVPAAITLATFKNSRRFMIEFPPSWVIRMSVVIFLRRHRLCAVRDFKALLAAWKRISPGQSVRARQINRNSRRGFDCA
jgi:hypothetical protein